MAFSKYSTTTIFFRRQVVPRCPHRRRQVVPGLCRLVVLVYSITDILRRCDYLRLYTPSLRLYTPSENCPYDRFACGVHIVVARWFWPPVRLSYRCIVRSVWWAHHWLSTRSSVRRIFLQYHLSFWLSRRQIPHLNTSWTYRFCVYLTMCFDGFTATRQQR